MSGRLTFPRRALILNGLIVAGFATGHIVRTHQSAAPMAKPLAGDATRLRPASSLELPPPPIISQPIPPDLVSSDTIGDLLAANLDKLYGRLALWLIDAESAEIAELFRELLDRRDLHPRHFNLLFIRWAATDPLAAIAAAKGTPHVLLPWSGWAKTRPLDAFRHALEEGRPILDHVVSSIGQYDPKLAQSLLAQHPDLPGSIGARGICQGLARNDPQAAIELDLQAGTLAGLFRDSNPLESWLRDDPHAAFEWFMRTRRLDSEKLRRLDDTVVASLARENPAVLAELAASIRPGDFRRKMEAAVFDQLAASDPAKALAEARETPSPMILRERLAKLGVLQLEKNPQAARAVFEELLALDPDPATRPFPPSPQATPEVFGLLTGMARQNPERTLTHILAASPDWNRSGEIVATRWAKDDPEALAAWALRHPDPKVRENCAPILIKQHSEANDFPKAMSFLEQVPAENRTSTATRIVSQWRDHDPQAARTWVEDAGMMDSMNMKHVFKNQ